MGAISGLITTYNQSNYTGELFNLSPVDAPFFTMAGGLSGGMQTTSTQFEWETEDVRASTANNVVLEGQDAPTGVGRTRSNVTNLCEIHQSAIDVSYTKLGAYGQKSGVNWNEPNPVVDEFAHQLGLEIVAAKRDLNASFLTGIYNLPTDNTTARKTRGIITAVATNLQDATAGVTLAYTSATNGTLTVSSGAPANGATVIFTSIVTNTEIALDTPYYVLNPSASATAFKVAATKAGAAITFAATGSGAFAIGATVTDTLVGGLLQAIWDNGGLSDSETFTVWVNSAVRRGLSVAYLKSYGAGYFVQSRSVGGLRVDTILTDFGTINVMADRQMPRHKMLAATMSEVAPVFLDIPNRGHFFVEPLAKTGAQEKAQLYGEIGLAYGAEKHHGVLTNLAAW